MTRLRRNSPTCRFWLPAAAQAKFDRMPAERIGFFGHLPMIGAPEQIVARIHELVAAGLQYLIFIVFDPESLQLLGEQVMPAVVG